jgi:nuclear transport factor 2 (NTF2) superfamily protein
MGHPKDDEVYYAGTVVRWKRTGEFALIKHATYRFPGGGGFMHYMAEFQDRAGSWVLYHDDVELECYPMSNLPST